MKKIHLEDRVKLHPEFNKTDVSGSRQSLRDLIGDAVGLDRSEARVKRAEKKLLTHLENREWGQAFDFSLKSFSTLSLAMKKKAVKEAVSQFYKLNDSAGEGFEAAGLVGDSIEGLDRGNIEIELGSTEFRGTEVTFSFDSGLAEDGVVPVMAEIPLGDRGDRALLMSPEAVGLEFEIGEHQKEGWNLSVGGRVGFDGESHAGFLVKTRGGFGGLAHFARGLVGKGDKRKASERPHYTVSQSSASDSSVDPLTKNWEWESEGSPEEVPMTITQAVAEEKVQKKYSWWAKLRGKHKKDLEEVTRVKVVSTKKRHHRDYNWDRLAPRLDVIQSESPVDEEEVAKEKISVPDPSTMIPTELPTEEAPRTIVKKTQPTS